MELKTTLDKICNDIKNNDHLTLLINDESNTMNLNESGIMDAIRLLPDLHQIKVENHTDWIDITDENITIIFDFLVHYMNVVIFKNKLTKNKFF